MEEPKDIDPTEEEIAESEQQELINSNRADI